MTSTDGYRREDDGAHPPHLSEAYASTALRSPKQPLVRLPHTLTEIHGPAGGGAQLFGPAMADLTRQHGGEPLGQRIIVAGRVRDEAGRYSFTSIRPGAYPWGNHPNAWRPAHIHLSLLGPAFATRLVTQMYFADDPLLGLDPIFNSVPTEAARQRLIAAYDHAVTEPEWALGWHWDIVLSGAEATPFEAPMEGPQ